MKLSLTLFGVLLCLLFSEQLSLNAQDLTISTSGQTGTSGTNWSITGNTLNVSSSGSASIHPSVITNHLTNTGNLTIVLPPQNSQSRDINISNNIAYTGSTARTLTFNSANSINVASGVNITSSTTSLNLVLRAAMGSSTPDHGRIVLDGVTISTKGGHVWAGGGSTNATWNGLAVGNSCARTWSDNIAGLVVSGGSITTEGGSIYLYGLSHDTGNDTGLNYGLSIENATISSSSGNINILGAIDGRYTNGIATRIIANTSSTSITSTSGTISISGAGYDQTTNGNGWRLGTQIISTSATIKTSITSSSGAITVEGSANFAATINDKEGLLLSGTGLEITSQTGNITLRGSNIREADGQYCNSIRFAQDNATNAIRIGYNGTNAYSGNILIEGNSIYQRTNNAGTGSISIQSTGTLTIQPTGTAFSYVRAGNSGTLTFDDDWNFGTTLSGFTYGKSTNTTALTYASALTVAGPITFYAGDFTASQNITGTLSSANILLQGTGTVTLAANRTIQSNAGNITLRSNAGGTATSATAITLNSGSSLLSQGGNITLGGNFTGAQGTGLYATGNGYVGIFIDNATISAAGGNIKLYGKNNASYNDGIRLQANITTTGSGTVEVYGEAHGGNNGTQFYGGITFANAASSIESVNGNLVVSGLLTNTQSTNTYGINFYRQTGSSGLTNHIQLISKTGNIQITGDRGTTSAGGIGHSSWGDIYIGSPLGGAWTATGNVVLNYSNLVNAGFNGFKVKTTGAVTYEPSATSFSAAQTFPATANYILAESASSLTIGKSGNTANVTLASSLTVAGPISIYGGTVALNAAVTATNSNLTIGASTAATQTAAITANGLALNGTGTFTLTNTSNNFATIAGGAVGNLIGATQIVDASSGLTIGTVGSNTGIIGSGTITIETLASNLTLSANISTTSTSTDAIILNAAKNTAIHTGSGGDILVTGSPTITLGTGGIAKLFSGLETSSTGLTTLVGGSANVRNGFDETTTTFTPALSVNTAHAIYRSAPGIGDLTIVSSGGHAEGSTWTYSSGVLTTTTSPVLVNASDVQSKLGLGSLSIEAGSITFSASISSSNANALSLRAKTHIVNTTATSITTQGGNVLLASNVDDATDGETTTNGRIDMRYGLTVTTNGGNITLGGENNDGSGYALGRSGGSYTEGIRIDETANLNSGGGNISIKGKSYNMAVGSSIGGSGVGFFFLTSAGSINSGAGTILIDGYSQTSAGDAIAGIFFWNTSANTFTIQSANTSASAITLNAFSSGTSGQAFGIETEGSNTLNIFATGSNGGITINTGNSTANSYDIVLRGLTNILASSGPIAIKGGQFGGTTNGYLYISNGLFLGSKASSTVTSSSSNITVQIDRFSYVGGYTPQLATSGAVVIESAASSFGGGTYTSWFAFNQNSQTMSSFRFGKTGNTSDIYLNTAFTVSGPISAYGWNVDVTGNLTSSANGDIFIKGISGWNDIEMTSTIAKTAGTGTLTLQSNGRANFAGPITASGTGVLNVVIWSDYDGDNGDGGACFSGAVTTNGGHVWMGGSNSNGGSYTWNGLTVGDGPSVGGSNANALDFFNNVTTDGGDVFVWAGTGNGGTNGIASNGSRTINAGSGDITLVSSVTSGTIGLTTTGAISMLPNGGSYASALTIGGTLTSGNFTFNTSHYNGIIINSIANVGGLTLGRFEGMLAAGSPVVMTNSSNITVTSAISIAGTLSMYGGTIALNANISTTNTSTGDVLLNGTTLSGTGNIAIASNRTATLSFSSSSTYDGIISGTGSGLTKSGAGLLTLTKDHTYSGTTTISAGDLQVGTGGSVSQASSGTISNTSSVAVSSGSKLILTPNENITFTASVSGAGGVEIKGASGKYWPGSSIWLTTTAVQLVANCSVLEALTRITGGKMGGNAITGGPVTCAAYQKSYNAATNTASLQLQAFNGDNVATYTKCVFVKLTQSGSNVMVQADNTILSTGAGYKSGNVLGTDIASGGSSMGLATASGTAGYGISEIYMSGKVNFTGSLTYTGNTVLSNTVSSLSATYNAYSYTSKGTQEITDASSSFPSTSTVVNNGLVILNRTTALTIASDMSGTEEVLQVGAAITFTGTNTYTGNTTIDLNKSLNIGSGSTSGSMTGNIINYGTLSFNRSDSSSYTGIISGTGTLSKSGGGDLTLTGLNTYTGSSTINAGRLILQRDVPATSSSSYSGAGILVIQPNSSSFTSAVTYPIPGFTVSSSIGGLTIGKTTNTANISVTASTTSAGPMTMYGGNISLAVGVELFTTAAGGNITLLGKSGFTTAANSGTSRGRIMTTGGGNIAINADADGNTVGELDIDWLTIDGGTGNVSMEAATFNWNTSSGVVYPEFYGTGALTFRGGAGSTHPLNLGWMALFQNKSALTVGNPSNTVVVDINPCSNCNSTAYNYTGNNLTVNGPVSIYGSTVSLGQSINSATGGNITLQANTLTFSSGKTVSSSGQLIVTAQTPSNSIGVAGATGSLQITTTHLSTNFTNGFSTVQIGSSSQTGNISTNVFTLQDDMSFLTSGTLTLGGKLAMGSNNVTLGSAISAISGTPTCYFQTNGTGTLSRTVANSASLIFPIGNAYYNPVTITNNTGSSDAFSMKVRDDVLEFGTTGSSITKAHVDVTWDINKTNANANSGVNFTLQWESAQERNSISSFALNHYNSSISAWEFAAGSSAAASGSTTKTMSHTGYTGSFSPFAIGDGVSALPVQLLHFDAILQNKNALLTWSTATENNNSGFEIMKSTDGQKWKSIGFVKGAGTTFETQKYRFVDYAFNTLAYYKLHQIDFNGIATPSPVRTLQSAASETPKVIVYPNPSNGKITVATGDLVAATFELYDATGRILEKGNLSQPHFDITGLTKGIYFLKVYYSMGVETLKICVE